MKKTFPLTAPNHQPPRVIAAIKNEVRKYLKRERSKTLPEGSDIWDFNCRIGFGTDTPEPRRAGEIIEAIDEAAAKQCGAVYIEILATPGNRKALQEQAPEQPVPAAEDAPQ